jgi:hypothetical protein
LKILRFDTDAREVYLCSARNIDILFIDINVAMLLNHKNLGASKIGPLPPPLAGKHVLLYIEVNSVRLLIHSIE